MLFKLEITNWYTKININYGWIIRLLYLNVSRRFRQKVPWQAASGAELDSARWSCADPDSSSLLQPNLTLLPWASPPLVSTAMHFPAPERFSKNFRVSCRFGPVAPAISQSARGLCAAVGEVQLNSSGGPPEGNTGGICGRREGGSWRAAAGTAPLLLHLSSKDPTIGQITASFPYKDEDFPPHLCGKVRDKGKTATCKNKNKKCFLVVEMQQFCSLGFKNRRFKVTFL